MPEERDRIIFDVNLLISFLITNDFSKFEKIIAKSSTKVLFSKNLLDEFIEVAQRPRFRKYFPMANFENFLLDIKDKTEFVEVTSDIKICRDPKDDFLLSLAKDGKATHLLTGDKDLTDMKYFEGTQIIKISDYLK